MRPALSTLLALLALLCLLAGCAGALERLASPKLDDQLSGITKLGEVSDPAIREQAIPRLFALLSHGDDKVKPRAFDALDAIELADGSRGLDHPPEDAAECGLLYGTFMGKWELFSEAQRARIIDRMVEQTCIEADEWIAGHLEDVAFAGERLRQASSLRAAVKLVDLMGEETLSRQPAPLAAYGRALSIVWMADFYLTGRVGAQLGEYGRKLQAVNEAKAALTRGLRELAKSGKGAGEETKALTKALNDALAALAPLEPEVRPTLTAIEQETKDVLKEAVTHRRAITDEALAARFDERMLKEDQLASGWFIVKWFKELGE